MEVACDGDADGAGVDDCDGACDGDDVDDDEAMVPWAAGASAAAALGFALFPLGFGSW